MVALITSILGLVALALNAYMAAAPERKQEQINDQIQKGRNDLVNGDIDAVQSRLDNILLAPVQDGANGGFTRGKDRAGQDGAAGTV